MKSRVRRTPKYEEKDVEYTQVWRAGVEAFSGSNERTTRNYFKNFYTNQYYFLFGNFNFKAKNATYISQMGQYCTSK